MARKQRKSKHVDGWLVAATHQDGEFEARRHLSRQGFEVELPLMRTPLNVRTGTRRVVPLFEGYIFVRENVGPWWSIRGTRGVAHLLMNCERPAVLADDELQFFLSGSVDSNGYYVDPVMKLYRVGDSVSPALGRFAGSVGRLLEMDATGRTEILFSMLGRNVVTKEYRVRDLA